MGSAPPIAPPISNPQQPATARAVEAPRKRSGLKSCLQVFLILVLLGLAVCGGGAFLLINRVPALKQLIGRITSG
jgi:hypothetical protein